MGERPQYEQDDAERKLRGFAGSYSDALELDHEGRLRWTRDVTPGEVVEVPLHLLETHLRNGWK